jgi:hypothetical protein
MLPLVAGQECALRLSSGATLQRGGTVTVVSGAGPPLATGFIGLDIGRLTWGLKTEVSEEGNALVATLPANAHGAGTLRATAYPKVNVEACEGAGQCFVGGLCAEARWPVVIE